MGAHGPERFYDPFHGPSVHGRVAGKNTGKGLGREDAGNDPGGGPAVAGIQPDFVLFGRKAPHAPSGHFDTAAVFGKDDIHAKSPEAVDGGKAVGPVRKTFYISSAPCQGAEHDSSVGDGFVSRKADFSPERTGGTKSQHKRSPVSFKNQCMEKLRPAGMRSCGGLKSLMRLPAPITIALQRAKDKSVYKTGNKNEPVPAGGNICLRRGNFACSYSLYLVKWTRNFA